MADELDTAGAVADYLGKPQNPAQAARTGVAAAIGTNPDTEAQLRAVARLSGLPVDTVRSDPERLTQQAQVVGSDFDSLAEHFPQTAAFLGSGDNAKVAHDDAGNLGLLETVLNSFRRGPPALQQGLAATKFRAQAGILSNVEMVERKLAAGERVLDTEDPFALQYMTPEQRTAFKAQAVAAAGRSSATIASTQATKAAIPSPDIVARFQDAKGWKDSFAAFFSDPVKFIASIGPESFVQSGPGMLAALLMPGGVAAKAATMGVGSSVIDYGSSILEALGKEGVNIADPAALQAAAGDTKLMQRVAAQAMAHASMVGAVDALSAGAAGRVTLPAKAATALAGRPVARELANMAVQAPTQGLLGAAGEAGGELAAGQPLDPHSIIAEFAGEFAGAPGEVAAMAAGRVRERLGRAQAAAGNAELFTQLNELSAASKVRARDGETFDTFLAAALQDGPVADVYVSAGALAQSGLAEQVIAASPSAAKQYPVALETGGDVRIPIDEYASLVAGQDFAQPLVDHLKTEPEGFSKAEATEYLAKHEENLRAEVEGILTQKQGDDVFKASRDAVQANVLDQLSKANRFTADVNAPYAALMANFYAVQGARVGLTPQEMLAKYPVRIQAQGTAGLAQTPATPAFKAWFGDSKVVDGKGEPLTVYHGTDSDFSIFDRSKTGKGPSKLGFWFTDLPDFAENFGGTLVPAHIAVSNPKRMSRERWDAIRSKHGGDPAFFASMRDQLIADGFDGLIVPGGIAKVGKFDVREPAVFAAFEPTQIKSSIGNSGAFDPSNPSILAQDQRGAFNPDTNTVALLKAADLSTFLHESGHFFLHVQAQMAAQPDAPAEVRANMDRLLDWFGVKAEPDADALTVWHRMTLDEQRVSHETFARGFERYLFEGKAPSVELQGIFQRFRAWLLNVYKSLKALDVQLTDDVRGVMDRMLATPAQIQTAEAAASMNALFSTPEEAAQLGVDWKAYHEKGLQATQDAITELETRSLRDMQWLDNARGRALKELQAQNAEKRKTMRREVRAEIMAQPVYQAWQYLTTRADAKAVPGVTNPDTIDTVTMTGKLRTGVLKEMFPDGSWRRLTDLRMTNDSTGQHPDIVSELFGFSSGDEMVRELLAAPTPSELVETLTDQRMLERYGDVTSPEALARAADEAVHNQARQKFVSAELAALDKAVRADGKDRRGRVINILPAAAKRFAADLVARKLVRDVHPEQYRAAEARAARESTKAFKAGKLDEAALQKRNQLINNFATRAAHDALAEVDKAVAYFRRLNSANSRRGIDTSYTDQIDALLEKFDLRPRSLKALDRRASLAEWVAGQREQGIEPDIPVELMVGLGQKNYREATVEEIRGLVDTVRQIEHLGRLKNKLLTAQDKREFDQIRNAITSGIAEHSQGRKATTRTINTTRAAVARGLKNFWASHIKMATWARIMDGGKDGGPVWTYLISSMNDAGGHETVMRAKATNDLAAIVAPLLTSGKLGGKGEFFPELGQSFNREAKLAIALNTGNEGNYQRLLDGQGWTHGQVKTLLDTLSPAEWDFVQNVWDYFETWRPEIAAKERRVYGKEPNWIDPGSPVTRERNIKGGYYPVKYDPRASARSEELADAEVARQQMQGAFTSATTRRSFTKERAARVTGRPLLYSFDGLYGGVQEVIHDLAWHEWLIDANRLVKNGAISESIRSTYGPEVHKQFKDAIEDIAVGEQPATRANEKALAWMRQGISVTGLGFNVMSALIQPLGLTQSIVRIGPKWVGKGLAEAIGSPLATIDRVNGASEFMRTRFLTRFRELNEIRNQVAGKTRVRQKLDQGAYYMMMRCQQLVDVPTWIGAYEKAVSTGEPEDRAIKLADSAVIEAQGSGMTKDLSGIERGGPAIKLFTTFYSFFNTTLNLGVAQTMTAQTKAQKAKLAADYALLFVVPAVLGTTFKAAMQGGDDFDDWEKFSKKLAGDQISYLTGLMFGIRELSGALQAVTGTNEYPTDYSGPAGIRVITDTAKLGKQVGQGEWDDALRKAIVNLTSELLRLPGAQINRTITGTQALAEGKTDNPLAPIVGYQEPKR